MLPVIKIRRIKHSPKAFIISVQQLICVLFKEFSSMMNKRLKLKILLLCVSYIINWKFIIHWCAFCECSSHTTTAHTHLFIYIHLISIKYGHIYYLDTNYDRVWNKFKDMVNYFIIITMFLSLSLLLFLGIHYIMKNCIKINTILALWNNVIWLKKLPYLR